MVETLIIKTQLRQEFPLTDNETRIINQLRSLNPFERVEIMADATGKLNNYIVIRSTKIVFSNDEPLYAPVRAKG